MSASRRPSPLPSARHSPIGSRLARTASPFPLRLLLLLLIGAPATDAAEAVRPPVFANRKADGLLALYDFQAVHNGVVPDRSTADQPLNLDIANPHSVRFTTEGMEVAGDVLIRSTNPAARVVKAVQRSGALSIELWLQITDHHQEGPARIVTISRDSGARNVTLGQVGTQIDVRLRTTATSANGVPSLSSTSRVAGTDWTHVVYTFDTAGRARLFVNGTLNSEQTIGGELSNWDDGFELALANELSGDRPWRGTLGLVAVYSRSLAPEEVLDNFNAGLSAREASDSESNTLTDRLFETRIAPLLSQHCLECHDGATRNGGLNLSQREPASAGGEQGPAIVPGRANESLLWQLVESDTMPLDRPALSADEKSTLKAWLDQGARWSFDVIDPYLYSQGAATQTLFVQRLTVPEYIETVRSTLGVDIAAEARELLPREVRADGFSNTSYNLKVDLDHIEAYAHLAGLIADRVDIAALCRTYTESRELTDENLTKVIEPIGRRLLRAPLTPEDVAMYCGVSTSVAGAGGDFEEAVHYVLQAMLQSPRFLYRIEDQRGNGGKWPLSASELAARISFIVWGAPPDDELLRLADEGKLDRNEVRRQLRRMLQDPRAIEQSRRFIAEWLNLDRLDSLRPDAQRFPHWDVRLAADMRTETLAFFEEVVWTQNRPLSELLNAQLTFVTPRLAAHYGLELPDGDAAQDELIRVDLESVGSYGGLLTQGSVLTVGGDDASTVTRGLFVMRQLLRGVVRDPPPCVDTTPLATRKGVSQRTAAEMRLANQACAGCHEKFEPLSFGLEKFDGLGTWREKDEHGNVLREDGSILFPGQAQAKSYRATAEMMDLLATSDRVAESFSWKLTQFALGRPLGAEDAVELAKIHERAVEAGGTYGALLEAIILSDLVQMIRTETTPVAPTGGP